MVMKPSARGSLLDPGDSKDFGFTILRDQRETVSVFIFVAAENCVRVRARAPGCNVVAMMVKSSPVSSPGI